MNLVRTAFVFAALLDLGVLLRLTVPQARILDSLFIAYRPKRWASGAT